MQGSEGPCMSLPHLKCELVPDLTNSFGYFGN